MGGEPWDPGAASEHALVQIAQGPGEPLARRAFGELARREQAWLLRYLAYVLGGLSDAEDVAQEVLARAFRGIRSYRGESSFRSWLRVIATRLAYNHSRSILARRRREASAREVGHDVQPSPHAALAARDIVEQVLAQLPYPYREVLLLRHVEELSLDEIADLLDIGLSAAKMRLGRARDQFLVLHEELG